jgi:hypothetical protein
MNVEAQSLGRARRGKTKPKHGRQPLEKIILVDVELRRG